MISDGAPGASAVPDMCAVLSGSGQPDSPAQVETFACSAPAAPAIGFGPPDGFAAAGAAMRAELRELTGQLFRAIAADPADPGTGRAVGARLVRIGFAEPDALARSVDILGPALAAAAGAGRATAVYALLGAVAAGHGDALRKRDLAVAAEKQRAELAALRSAQRARRDGAAQFRAAFDHAGIGALVVADCGEIVEVNDTASQIVGRDLAHLSIGDVWDLVHSRDRAELIDMWAAVRAGRSGHGVWRLDRPAGPDGGPVWVALTATMVEDDAARVCFAVTIEDVTYRPDPRYTPERGGPAAPAAGLTPTAGTDSALGRQVDATRVSESDQAAAAARMTRGIAAALRDGQFVVHYQPIVRLLDGRIQGAEALVRWNHPRLGMRRPEEFIGAAEESGLIVPLGLHVLETACQDAARWANVAATAPALGDDEPPVRPFVSVNLSVRQLEEPDTVPVILRIVERAGIEPGRLQLELVESLMLDTVGRPLEALRALAAAGIRIAIDDFGTGYSNFAYLPTLPVRALKLAGQFAGQVDDDADGPDGDPGGLLSAVALDHMVEGIVLIAHRLGHTVTVEGVETREQAARMLAHGADFGQGHLFGHPVCADKLAAVFAGEPANVGGTHGPRLAAMPVPSARDHRLHDHAAPHRWV
ncbi:EAL domain-containing protein [Pseudofrankia sp. DC12]|uniref:EAL domain-containing protein n=1 Tax=Pseudofrankia sp. DC12 TaxID=683315 RepID=UPI001E5B3CCE|nr:EAL domain-containing protein [Pseudofrankia sp. DC12]